MDLKLMIFGFLFCTLISIANCGEKKVIIHIPYTVKNVKHTHTIIKTIHHKKEDPHEHHHHHHHHHHVDDHQGHDWDTYGSESQTVTTKILPTKRGELSSSLSGYRRGARQTAWDLIDSTTPEQTFRKSPSKLNRKRNNSYKKKH